MAYHSGSSAKGPIPLHSEQRGLPEIFTYTVTNCSQSEYVIHELHLNMKVRHAKNSKLEMYRDPIVDTTSHQHGYKDVQCAVYSVKCAVYERSGDEQMIWKITQLYQSYLH